MSTVKVNTLESIDGTYSIDIKDIQEPIGVGQTWQDVTAQRALNTDYTNGTGRPIEVSVAVRADATTYTIEMRAQVDGVLIAYIFKSEEYSRATVTFIVPAGSVYTVNSGADRGDIETWAELRS